MTIHSLFFKARVHKEALEHVTPAHTKQASLPPTNKQYNT